MPAVWSFKAEPCFCLALHQQGPGLAVRGTLTFPAPLKLSIWWACSWPSAGPRRWLRSPTTLINHCFPTWRVGLQSDRRVISLQAAAAPARGAKKAHAACGCAGAPPPVSMSGTLLTGSVCDTVPVSSPAIQTGGTTKATAEHPESRA